MRRLSPNLSLSSVSRSINTCLREPSESTISAHFAAYSCFSWSSSFSFTPSSLVSLASFISRIDLAWFSVKLYLSIKVFFASVGLSLFLIISTISSILASAAINPSRISILLLVLSKSN